MSENTPTPEEYAEFILANYLSLQGLVAGILLTLPRGASKEIARDMDNFFVGASKVAGHYTAMVATNKNEHMKEREIIKRLYASLMEHHSWQCESAHLSMMVGKQNEPVTVDISKQYSQSAMKHRTSTSLKEAEEYLLEKQSS